MVKNVKIKGSVVTATGTNRIYSTLLSDEEAGDIPVYVLSEEQWTRQGKLNKYLLAVCYPQAGKLAEHCRDKMECYDP